MGLELSLDMKMVLNAYCERSGRKLYKLVDHIVNKKFGGTMNKDMPEYYSMANSVIFDIVRDQKFNPEFGDFDGYLYNSLVYTFIDYQKMEGRQKRKNIQYLLDEKGNRILDEHGVPQKVIIPDISLDEKINDDESGLTYSEIIQSENSNVEDIVANKEVFNERMVNYFNSLSEVQKQIVQMKMDDVPISEIKRKLHLTEKKYVWNCNQIKSFEKISLLGLKKDKYIKEGKEMSSNTMEKDKTMKLSVSSIIKKMNKKIIRFDHPLQRESDQWTVLMKSNLISDILQGNPLPELVFAEQVINGIAIIWDLDGKQRCTNVYAYINNAFRISKNVTRWMIEYQVPVLDDKGQQLFDENHMPMYEKKEFDIRNKKFSNLPEQLQDNIMDYSFNIVQYLNCSSDDIAYHITRYNDGKRMTASQKGITKLGEEYAGMVKSISNMSFFKNIGGYKGSEFGNGVINRVIIESVMASNYLNDWKKKPDDMCEFLKKYASPDDFSKFEADVSNLEKVITDETADMFDSKDSFLWFGLYSIFSQYGIDDSKFIEFMEAFKNGLDEKALDGITYKELVINSKSTKDKAVVTKKIAHLERLMNEFLHINKEDIIVNDDLKFLKENVRDDITYEDVEFFNDCLDDYTVNVDNSSKLLEKQNHLSLVSIIAYALLHQMDDFIEDWLVDYFGKTSDYMKNQKENYLHMKQDLDNYTAINAA